MNRFVRFAAAQGEVPAHSSAKKTAQLSLGRIRGYAKSNYSVVDSGTCGNLAQGRKNQWLRSQYLQPIQKGIAEPADVRISLLVPPSRRISHAQCCGMNRFVRKRR